MKKSIPVIVFAVALAVFAFAAGVGVKKNPLSSNKSPVYNDSSGVKLKMLIPDFSLPILPIDASSVESLPEERIFKALTPLPLKQKIAELEDQMKAGLSRGEDVSALQAELDALLNEWRMLYAVGKGPVAPLKSAGKQRGWTTDPFQTAATRGETVMPPAETDPQLLQVRELEREAEDMRLAGQDISDIKARLNALYERIMPQEPKAIEKPASFNEQFSRMQDDHTPPSPLLYTVKDAPASAPNAVKRFWEPGDAVGMQIEELNRQAAEIERKGGDVAEIKARMNALYEMLPAYRGKMSPSTGENALRESERFRFPQDRPKQMILYDGKIIEVEPGVSLTELPIPEPERTRTGTLDENGGTIFEFASNNPIPDNNWISFGKLVDMGESDTILVDIEVTIDTLFHEYDGDLEISLISPQGDTCILSNRNGGLYDNYIETVFDDEATTSITAGSAPFTGNFRPEEPLSQFDGINPNGTWWLLVRDLAPGDVGVMRRWHLQVRANRVGDDCDHPLFTSLNTMWWIGTCYFHNDYDYACPYSSTAPDVVLAYNLTTTQQVFLNMCPSGYDTKLMVYRDVCGGTPIACSDDADPCPSSAQIYRSYIPSLTMEAGHTYYVVLDGYGTSCGLAYLEVVPIPPCDYACQPQDIIECAENQDSLHFRDDCNGGPCNSEFWDPGPPRFESIQNGQTVCGRLFSVNWIRRYSGGESFALGWDLDWYRFSLDQPSNVHVTAASEYPFIIAIADTDTCAFLSTQYYARNGSVTPCSTLSADAFCLSPGVYAAVVEGIFYTQPQNYRLTINWTPCDPGQGCATAYEFTGDTVFIGHTTCGLGNEYSNTCLGDYDGGEDVIYKWHVTEAGDYTIWLNPYFSSWTGVVLDSVCPPRASGCIAVHAQALNASHGIVGQHLIPGIYYIMVDTWPAPDCIPRYDLSVGRYDNCSSCLPADSIECAETPDSMHAYHDCNGGCFTLDGNQHFQSIQKNDTLCGSVFTYVRGDSVFSDIDWYYFTLTEWDTFDFIIESEFDYNIHVGRLVNGCDSIYWQASSSAWGSQCIPNGMGWCCAAPGEWVLTVRSYNIAPVPQDYRLVVIAAPALNGFSCYIPQIVSGEDTLTNQTTCGFESYYDQTCLGSWDSGKQKFYQWTVSEAGHYTIWMDPGTSTWTSLLLDDNCPPDTVGCLATSFMIDAIPHGFLCQYLTPGVYHLMVSTWPEPDCIPEYTLYLKRCCVVCQPGDAVECTEFQTVDNLSQDCDGGCNNDDFGGINHFGVISCEQTVCGRGFTFEGGRDTDWYEFTIGQRESLRVMCSADFPFVIYLLDSTNGCSGQQLMFLDGDTADACQTAAINTCVDAGRYFVWVGPRFMVGVDIPGQYRLTLNCSPCTLPGENCNAPIEISDDTTLTSLTTCGLTNDYDNTCAYYEDGEDLIIRWTVAQAGMYTVWLDPHGTMSTDIVVDNQCPPRHDGCLAHHDSYQSVQHGVCVSAPAGVYYIMVGSTALHGCITEFDLSISQSAVPANDLCGNAIPLTVPQTIYGSTKCATVDSTPDCWEDPPYYPGVWYTVIGTGNTITANICSSSVQWDNRMGVYTCGCDRLYSVACESELCDPSAHLRPVSWCSRVGEEYRILIHGLWGGSGDFRLDVTDDGIPCSQPARCPCWDTTLTAPGTYSGSTIGAGNNCIQWPSEDQVIRVLIPSAGRWKFTTCGTSPEWDTHLKVGTDCCLQDVGSSDDIPCEAYFTNLSTLCLDLPVAGVYFVTMEGHRATVAGDYLLTVEPTTGHAPDSVQGVAASTQYCDSIVVTWQDNPDEQAYAILIDNYWGYDLQPNTTRYVFHADTPGVHAFSLEAVNYCGWSVPSETVEGSMQASPDQVTEVSASDSLCHRTEIHWSDISDETGYRVYRDGAQIGADLPANTIFFYDSTGAADIAYGYTVAAFNPYCEGVPSPSDSGTLRTAPPQPSGVTATDTLCDGIEVCWSDAAGETGYRVLRNGSQIGGDLPANTVSYHDMTAMPGHVYGYSIVSVNSYCSSIPSAADSGSRLITPDQVTGVIASDTSCDIVQITWMDVSNETGYTVYRNGLQISALLAANTTLFSDTTATPGARYAYGVRSVASICEGQISAIDSGARVPTPDAVTGCVATDSRCDSIIVTWGDVADETGYRVLRNGLNASGDLPTGTTRYADGHAGINVTYDYSVVSFYLHCEAPPSQTDQGIRPGELPAVSGVMASDTFCTGVRVCWNSLSEADSFQIQRDSVRIGAAAENDTCFFDTLAVPWVNYQYRVVAYNVCGAGLPSLSDQGSRWSIPPIIAGFTASDSQCGAVILSWTQIAIPCSLQITRDGVPLSDLPGTTTGMVDSNACIGGTHLYCISAHNACGASPEVCDQGACRLPPDQSPQPIFPDTCTAAQLCWTDVLNEEGYRIYRNSELIGSAGANITCMDVITPQGIAVCYTVQAFNGCGSGPMSLPICITLPRTPPQVTIWRTDSCTFSFCWSDVSNETHYVILRDGQAVDSVLANSTCYTDLMPLPGTCIVRVCAANACGNGPLSNPLTITLPYVPSVTQCDATNMLCTGVNLTWMLTPGIAADSMVIQRDGIRIAATSGNDTNFTDLTASPFLMHNYTIAPYNTCGEGLSCSDSGRMLQTPGQVLNVTATVNRCDSIIVTWTDPGNEIGYRIYRDDEIFAAGPDITRFADAPAAGSHIYSVRATGVCGDGPVSDSTTGIRLAAPGIPASITATDDQCGSVVVWWGSATGDVDEYRFFRDGSLIGAALPDAESFVDSPVAGGHAYTVAAYSTECGLGGQSASDSGNGRQPPTEISNLEFVLPPVCDSIRLTWQAANGDVDGYAVARNGAVIDTAYVARYTDYAIDDDNDHPYTVTAFNSFCGGGPTSTPVIGHELPLMDIITGIPDTILSGQWFVMALRHCSGVDSTRVFLSLNGGSYEHLRTILPSDSDSLLFTAVTEDVPDCRLQALTIRNARIDTMVTRSFILRAAVTAVDPLAEIPKEFFLDQNYPNPFNPTTTIRFGLPRMEEVTMTVFDITGRQVATLITGHLPPGVHFFRWDCNACPSGMYLIRMQAGDRTFLKKMLLMK